VSALELDLRYEHGRWHARGADVELDHAELRGLEALIEARVASAAAAVEVRLGFDMAALPRWLHQFHGHYCNYTLLVPRRGAP
jgi:hypothetical protein